MAASFPRHPIAAMGRSYKFTAPCPSTTPNPPHCSPLPA